MVCKLFITSFAQWFIGFKLISIVHTLHSTKHSTLLLSNCSPFAKLYERQCYHSLSKFPFETVWRSVQTVSWAWMTSESLFQAVVEAEHDRKSCTAAAHTVLWDRQSPALQARPSLPRVLQVSLGLLTDKEKRVCRQQHSLFFCREYFLKVKQRRSSKNEQLCHYLLCWDLSRDHFKDPYCLQQLMSAASAEAVLSLKVLTYLQFSVLSLVLICHFKMNAPFVKANYLHEHCTSSKSLICLTFLLAAILYFALYSTCKKERFCSKIFLCCDKARTGGGKLSYLPDGSLNFSTWNALSHCSALAWFLVLE